MAKGEIGFEAVERCRRVSAYSGRGVEFIEWQWIAVVEQTPPCPAAEGARLVMVKQVCPGDGFGDVIFSRYFEFAPVVA